MKYKKMKEKVFNNDPNAISYNLDILLPVSYKEGNFRSVFHYRYGYVTLTYV